MIREVFCVCYYHSHSSPVYNVSRYVDTYDEAVALVDEGVLRLMKPSGLARVEKHWII